MGSTAGIAHVKPVALTQATSEKHIDKSGPVCGKYTLMKLPITKGVTIWNPTAIVESPDGVIFVANYTGEIYSLKNIDGYAPKSFKIIANGKNYQIGQ